MPGDRNPIRKAALKVALALREVSDLGPGTSAAIVSKSLEMSVRQRRDGRAEDRWAARRGPGELLSVEPLAIGDEPVAGVRCCFSEGDLELRFLDDDLVRATWGPGDLPVPWALANHAEPVLAGRAEGPVVSVVVEYADHGEGVSGCSVTSPALRVSVAADGTVRYFDHQGALLRHELPPLRRGASRTARHLLRPGERVSGLGEQGSSVDLRGTIHRLWNRDPGGAWGPGQDPLYCGIPVLVGLHPDGDVLAFYENSYEATVRIDGEGSRIGSALHTEITFAGGMLRHYLAVGPLPRLLERYTELTGRPPLPPRWALGYHQCKWGYKDEGDVREVADGFRDEGLPLSAVHLDIDYMDGYRVFSVDPERFPDLGALSRDLGTRGTRIVTIVDPAVKEDPDYEVYRDGRASGRFLRDGHDDLLVGVVWPGRAVFPDFTDPATRAWWSGWYRRLLDAGVAGIWHDMNEPTSITLWGDRTVPTSTRHSVEGRGGDHRECHNVYGQLMNEAGWDALRTARPDRRPFVLSRAGWAGMQRHAWNWTGDVESTWGGLRQQVATTIGLGLSGVAFTGSDIGGFSGVPSPELYLRWLELSVLMPFCRTHSVLGSPNREPWRFPEPHRSAIGRLIRLRYRLMPYLYALAEEASRIGHPLVRPLCWSAEGAGSSADPRLWTVDDAYLLGDALLVAPVVTEGARARTVPLPTGRWYRWRFLPAMPVPAMPVEEPVPAVAEEVSVVEGGRTVLLDAPAGQPVVLVREGTVLVLDDGWVDDGWVEGSTGDERLVPRAGTLSPGHQPRLMALHCFPDTAGAALGSGYDDAGDGYGPTRRDRFELTSFDDGGATLRWERAGDYELPDRIRVVLHGLAFPRGSTESGQVAVDVSYNSSGAPSTTIDCGSFANLRLER